MKQIIEKDIELINSYQDNWNKFSRDVLGVKLDTEQEEILFGVQNNKRVSVKSGHARGKDYVAAVASLCFLYLNVPSKVINTAPTGRQVNLIMMTEISKIFRNAKIPLGGELLSNMIKFNTMPDIKTDDWFLVGFKAGDKDVEAWSGFHSPNIMVVVTEATGIDEENYNALEGILQANSRLLIVYNPHRLSGEAYESSKSPRYKHFTMNCLNAPNVLNWQRLLNKEITEQEYKKLHISGQVDWEWINDKVQAAGWCSKIPEEEVSKEFYDFQWMGIWYRPGNLFRVKVLGEFPEEDEETLIPIEWINAANERWKQFRGKFPKGMKLIGTDVAGMGRDKTAHVPRIKDVVFEIKTYSQQDHMVTAGQIVNMLADLDNLSFIDTIGEGAGVYSRVKEMKPNQVFSVKASHSAKFLRDLTGQRTFANMRAYLFWALRDWLDPAYKSKAALPPIQELTQELNEIRWEVRSNGDIIIEPKEELKKRLGRSPDYADALANTFFPYKRKKITNPITKAKLGIY